MEIRIIETRAEREQVYALRYEAYVQDMGRSMRYADPTRMRIAEPLDEKGHHFGCYVDDALIGAVRFNLGIEDALGEYEQLYQLDKLGRRWLTSTSVTSRLVVAHKWRGSRVAIRLASEVCRLAVARGVRYDAIDCHPTLLRLYKRLGYREHIGIIEHPDNGNAHCLVLDLWDQAHLSDVRSPLQGLTFTNQPDVA